MVRICTTRAWITNHCILEMTIHVRTFLITWMLSPYKLDSKIFQSTIQSTWISLIKCLLDNCTIAYEHIQMYSWLHNSFPSLGQLLLYFHNTYVYTYTECKHIHRTAGNLSSFSCFAIFLLPATSRTFYQHHCCQKINQGQLWGGSYVALWNASSGI